MGLSCAEVLVPTPNFNEKEQTHDGVYQTYQCFTSTHDRRHDPVRVLTITDGFSPVFDHIK